MLIEGLVNCFTNPLATSIQATGNVRNYQIVIGCTLLTILPLSYLGIRYLNWAPSSVFIVSDSIENFCAKIAAGKRAQKTRDFMICARIESLILEKGMDDALTRAFAFVKAGADAIMIHSRKKDPTEIFTFVEKFREKDTLTPVVVVPTSFNTVTEDEFRSRGVNIVIYANQLTSPL